jgi:hypothetical protein
VVSVLWNVINVVNINYKTNNANIVTIKVKDLLLNIKNDKICLNIFQISSISFSFSSSSFLFIFFIYNNLVSPFISLYLYLYILSLLHL